MRWREIIAGLASAAVAACSGGAASGGADCGPTVVSTFPEYVGVASMAVVGDDVFWAAYERETVDSCAGGLFSAPRGGGAPVKVDAGCAQSIAFDADRVFWTDLAPVIGKGALWSRSRSSGTSTQLAQDVNFMGVASGPQAVYAISVSSDLTSSLVQYDPAGGSPQKLQTISSLVDKASFRGPIAADATSVYWTRSVVSGNPRTDILKMDASGGPVRVLASTSDILVWRMVIDANRLYWNTWRGGGDPGYGFGLGPVMSIPLSGGEPTQLVPDGSPGGFVVDSTYLYWTDLTPKRTSIKKVPLAGGSPVTIVDDAGGLTTDIAIDDRFLYYSNSLQLYRVCK